MTQFYDILDKLKDELLKLPNVNTVTTGNLSEIDLTKTTIYPLTHIIVENAVLNTKTITFNVRMLCMDIVNQTNELSTEDSFYGNDNRQDILNSQLLVINTINNFLSRGSLYAEGYQSNGNLSVEPFEGRFEDVLAGWEGVLSISVINDLTIC